MMDSHVCSLFVPSNSYFCWLSPIIFHQAKWGFHYEDFTINFHMFTWWNPHSPMGSYGFPFATRTFTFRFRRKFAQRLLCYCLGLLALVVQRYATQRESVNLKQQNWYMGQQTSTVMALNNYNWVYNDIYIYNLSYRRYISVCKS